MALVSPDIISHVLRTPNRPTLDFLPINARIQLLIHKANNAHIVTPH